MTGDISLHCTALHRTTLHIQIKWQEEPQVTSLHIGHLLDTALSSGEKYFQARALELYLLPGAFANKSQNIHRNLFLQGFVIFHMQADAFAFPR